MTKLPLRILILEDNSTVIDALKSAIGRYFVGAQLRIECRTDALDRLSPDQAGRFDVILLDYVCLTGGNFHQAPLEAMGIERVISMSSSDRFNERASARGVTTVVKKPLHSFELTDFTKAVIKAIDQILPKDRQRRADGLNDHSEAQKKQHERELIEKFLARCPDYADYRFLAYDENPDLIYQAANDLGLCGFESVIIATEPTAIRCYFDTNLCRLTVPTLHNSLDIERLQAALITQVLDHLRPYKLPTVLVLTVIGSQLPLMELVENLRLPEIASANILAYYLINELEVLRLATNKSV